MLIITMYIFRANAVDAFDLTLCKRFVFLNKKGVLQKPVTVATRESNIL